MGGLPTIHRGISYAALSTISRGYLGDGIPPDPGLGGGRFRRLSLSLRNWL